MTEKTGSMEIDRAKAGASAKTVSEFVKLLESEIKDVDSNLVPLLRIYLNDVREVRMAFSREVKDILQSSAELAKVAKQTDEIVKFLSAVELLKKTLTPEVMNMISRLVGDKK